MENPTLVGLGNGAADLVNQTERFAPRHWASNDSLLE